MSISLWLHKGSPGTELWQLNLNTLEASFLPELEKHTYRQEWQAFLTITSATLVRQNQLEVFKQKLASFTLRRSCH
jgi:hypothetical protein